MLRFNIKQLLKRYSDFGYSSIIVLKRYSYFKCIKIFIKFCQTWDPGRPKSRSRGVLGGLRQPKRAKQILGTRPGEPRAAKMGPTGPQDTPKAPKMVPKCGQNWLQNRSKMGSDSEYPKMSISIIFWVNFPSKKHV